MRALGGFTTMLGVGAGYAPGMPEGQSAVGSMIELGFGYTWRRRPRGVIWPQHRSTSHQDN
jgi:hypothetical protein